MSSSALPRVLVFGASGETGRELVKELTRKKSSYSRVVLVLRRRVEEFDAVGNENLEQLVLPDGAQMIDLKSEDVRGKEDEAFDVAFCCIGTSFNKVNKAEFEAIERDLVIRMAELSKELGCKHFHLVTGYASDANSAFFIPRVKGESEVAVGKLGFPGLFVYRPGLLRCARRESRPMEAAARWVSDLVDRGDWWSVSTAAVARVLSGVALEAWQQGKEAAAATATTIMEHGEMVRKHRELAKKEEEEEEENK